MSDHLDRAAELIHSRIDPQGQITDGIGVRCVDAARALDAAGLLASPEHDAAVIEKFLRERDTPSVRIENPEAIIPLLARAWDEGFKQGGPMHDVNYDDPDAHTRNPYEREAGESGADA